MVDPAPLPASEGELRLVERLLAGDEESFAQLVDRYQASMLRLARVYVPSLAVAEEVVQEAWLGVLKGLEGFQGRSSLRTWIFRIVVNTAKTRGQRESRSVPFSSAFAVGPDEPAVDPERFAPEGHWSIAPNGWQGIPEERLLGNETFAAVGRAIAELPTAQAQVIELRDVQGWSSVEVCNALGISETNQRVLLHRARAKVRRALERYLESERAAP